MSTVYMYVVSKGSKSIYLHIALSLLMEKGLFLPHYMYVVSKGKHGGTRPNSIINYPSPLLKNTTCTTTTTTTNKYPCSCMGGWDVAITQPRQGLPFELFDLLMTCTCTCSSFSASGKGLFLPHSQPTMKNFPPKDVEVPDGVYPIPKISWMGMQTQGIAKLLPLTLWICLQYLGNTRLE